MFKGDKNRKFGFVGFMNEDCAIEAQKQLNGTFIDTAKIVVDFAQTNQQMEGDDVRKKVLGRKSEIQKSKDEKRAQKITKPKKIVEEKEESNEEEEEENGKNDDNLKKRGFDDFLDLMEIDKSEVKKGSNKKLKREEE